MKYSFRIDNRQLNEWIKATAQLPQPSRPWSKRPQGITSVILDALIDCMLRAPICPTTPAPTVRQPARASVGQKVRSRSANANSTEDLAVRQTKRSAVVSDNSQRADRSKKRGDK